jgi:hypothetical protein
LISISLGGETFTEISCMGEPHHISVHQLRLAKRVASYYLGTLQQKEAHDQQGNRYQCAEKRRF